MVLWIGVVLALWLGPQAPAAQSPPPTAWPGWQMLIGDWVGDSGKGVPGSPTSSSFSFAYDLDRRVIVRRDRADYPATKDRPAFRHDGLMIISQDDNKQVLAISYDNEGHMIPYDVVLSAKKAVFTSPSGTAGPRFRLTYVETTTGLAVRFEIAPPDHPDQFAVYVEGTAHRAGK